MIIVSEAARKHFLEIKPAGRSNGEVMRLETAGASANGEEAKVALYLAEPKKGTSQ